jgi:3-isopropylmalate/(R)-2-methylmalate dehydratase small subunit
MEVFDKLSAIAAPLALSNVDTDQIIPKQFLTTTTRTGLGDGLFYDFRFDESGAPKPDFVLNKPQYKGAKILIAGDNFGCGSSREHAPWALLDFGIKCVIAPSFADIFYNNCFKNGILPIKIAPEIIDSLMLLASGHNGIFDINLEAQTITAPDGKIYSFEISPNQKKSLLLGLDDIGDSLTHSQKIQDFIKTRANNMPWL